MIDKKTFEQFRRAQKLAQERGLSLEEVLDRAELLLTPRRRHDIVIGAIAEVIRRLERQAPNKLMSHFHGKTEGTAAEGLIAAQQWLLTYHRLLVDHNVEEL